MLEQPKVLDAIADETVREKIGGYASNTYDVYVVEK